jgi:hypothetical protein
MNHSCISCPEQFRAEALHGEAPEIRYRHFCIALVI